MNIDDLEPRDWEEEAENRRLGEADAERDEEPTSFLRTLAEMQAATARVGLFLLDPAAKERLAQAVAIITDACRPISLGILTQPPHREYRPAHRCDDTCMCFASGCSCPYCAPVVAQVDALITDERGQGTPDPETVTGKQFAQAFETSVAMARLEAGDAQALAAAVADGEIRPVESVLAPGAPGVQGQKDGRTGRTSEERLPGAAPLTNTPDPRAGGPAFHHEGRGRRGGAALDQVPERQRPSLSRGEALAGSTPVPLTSKHSPAELCDCPSPKAAGRPYHCAAGADR